MLKITPIDFVAKWKLVTSRERQTSQEHFIELCHLVGHDTPNENDPGGVTRTHIADLKNSVEREGAQIGLFVTLAEPTEPMHKEALSAGYYASPIGKSFSKIQILTIEDLLSKKQLPQYQDLSCGGLIFKKPKTEEEQANQIRLL